MAFLLAALLVAWLAMKQMGGGLLPSFLSGGGSGTEQVEDLQEKAQDVVDELNEQMQGDYEQQAQDAIDKVEEMLDQ